MKRILAIILMIVIVPHLFASDNQVDVGTIERDGQTIVSVQTNPTGDINIQMFGARVHIQANNARSFEKAIAKGLELIDAVNTNDITVEYRRSLGQMPVSYRGARMSFVFTANRGDGAPKLSGFISSAPSSYRSEHIQWSLNEEELLELQQLLSTAKTTQGDLSEEIALLNSLFEDWSIY